MTVFRQVVRFGLVGVVNTGTYFAFYLLLRLALPYLVAHVIAFGLSTIGSFFLNCWFTYNVKPTLKRFFLFPLTTLTNFVFTTVGVFVLVEWVGIDERPAPLLAAAAAIPVTFLVARTILVPKDQPVSPSRSYPRLLEVVTAAVLAVGVYLGTLVARRVYPAGDNSILTHDLYGQYAAMFSYLHNAMLGPEGLMFSWQGDLGMNFFPLAAYYLASPFNVIAILVGDQHLPEALIAITGAKVAAAAACMTWYLRRTFPGPRPLVIAAAVTYASMSWLLFQASNIMWVDALYLLPLILLAIERLLAGRGAWPLAAAIGATLLINYYSGVMAIMFAGCYLVVRYVAVRDELSFRDIAGTAARAATMVVLGVLCAGVVLVPSLRAIGSRYADPVSTVKADVPLPWVDLLSSLFGGTMEDRLRGAPHLAVGTLTLVFALTFFALGAIKVRERIGFAVLAGFLVAACQVPALYLLWHGFEVPSSYPHRFGFVLSFLIVLLGYRAAVCMRGRVAAGAMVVAAVVAVATAVWAAGLRPDLMTDRLLVWTILLVTAGAVAGSAYALLRHGEHVRRPLVAALAILLILDAGGAAVLASTSLDRVPRDRWTSPGPAWGEQLAAWRPKPDEFYRADALSWQTANNSLRFGNFAMTHYSSITNGRLHGALHALGFSDPIPYVRFDYQGSTLVTDALFGFRYVLSDRPLDRPGYQLLSYVPAADPSAYEEPTYAYRNANALPVGFFFDPAPLASDLKSPVAQLENLIGDQHLFTDVCPGNPVATGGTIRAQSDSVILTRDPAATSASLRWTCTATGEQLVYVWHDGQPGVSDVSIDDRPPLPYPTLHSTGPLDLGRRKNATFTVEIATRAKVLDVPRSVVQGLDIARFQRWIQSTRSRAAHDVHWSSAGLAFNVDDARGGRLFVSVPHVQGWQAHVDAVPTTIQNVAGAFIGLDLPPGAHHVELAFRPPGLRAGLLSTSVGIVGVGLLALASLRRQRRRASGPVGPSSAPEHVSVASI
jgi:uncharacterized membrane protein YfhO/putative flippase GtrA